MWGFFRIKPQLQTRPGCSDCLMTRQKPGRCYLKTSKTKTEHILKKRQVRLQSSLDSFCSLSQLILMPTVALNLFSCCQTDSPFHRERVLSSLLSYWCEREDAGRITHITEAETERVRAERGDGSERCRHEGNAITKIQNLDHKTVNTRLLQLHWLVGQDSKFKTFIVTLVVQVHSCEILRLRHSMKKKNSKYKV